MIGYVTVGTNDLKKAADFYDKICRRAGHGTLHGQSIAFIAWGGPGGGAGFGVGNAL